MKHIVKTQKNKINNTLATLVLETLIYNSFYKIQYYYIHKIYDILKIFTPLVIKFGFTSHNFRLTLRGDLDLKSSKLKLSLYKNAL